MKWLCDTCQTINNDEDNECVICGDYKPNYDHPYFKESEMWVRS